ncbi:MAG: amino acid transporter [Acidobacteriota bacterium]|nr:amino acid transporter [Acidobacteriota bacterium]
MYKGIEASGPHATAAKTHTSPWWQVMCLTGVDYFSTLGYQPGIAFLAAGYLAPVATLILALITLFGALPVYARVAALSPHGQGSIAVLEERLPRWRGKLAVLCLLGFAATGFIITITLSAADATAHIVENPFTPEWMKHEVGVTIALLLLLGAVLLKGFKEAIWLAVIIVAAYLALNLVVIGNGLLYLSQHTELFGQWRAGLYTSHTNFLAMIGLSLMLFPRLALGLSGFETGVAVMPLVAGYGENDKEEIAGRIRNTKLLLAWAAIIMSVYLVTSSIVTTLLIPAAEFERGGEAYGRALAYLAHRDLGSIFGTAYDVATIMILWFAGASALTGLLNLVPRYLPRYGMAPEWARATRPLVLLITAIGVIVTIAFRAGVEAQAGAYATGVLALMTSTAVAAMIGTPARRIFFGVITIVFLYTTVVNIIERPEGIVIAAWFIAGIVGASLFSRVWRSTELRAQGVDYDQFAQVFVKSAGSQPIRIIANRPDSGQPSEYAAKIREATDAHHLPPDAKVLFLEINPGDASEFSDVLHVHGRRVGDFEVLSVVSPAIPNAIAALLLDLRDRTGQIPHAYFGWTEGNPITYLLRFLAFGEGDTAPVTREVLRQAEPVPARRPRIHVG